MAIGDPELDSNMQVVAERIQGDLDDEKEDNEEPDEGLPGHSIAAYEENYDDYK